MADGPTEAAAVPMEADSSATNNEGRTAMATEDKDTANTAADANSTSAAPAGERRRKKRMAWDAKADGEPVAPAAAAQPIIVPLPLLTPEQQMRLHKAQSFALEQTVKFRTSMTSQMMMVASGLPVPMSAEHLQAQQEKLAQAKAIQIMCRLYVGSINFELNEEHLRPVFEQCGFIKEINLAFDQVAKKHKGYCFVEYDQPEAVVIGESLNGYLFGGRPIKVGRPNSAPTVVPVMEQLRRDAELFNRIYISNISRMLLEKDIRFVFEPFGTIKSMFMPQHPTVAGLHRGYCYIQYETKQSANDAVQSMDRMELGGLPMRVCSAVTPPMEGSLVPGDNQMAVPAVPPPPAYPAAGLLPLHPGPGLLPTIALPTAPAPVAAAAATISGAAAAAAAAAAVTAAKGEDPDAHSIHDKHGDENISISGTSQRFMMMQKLARREQENCLVRLMNMVSPDEVDEMLEQEVKEECFKFGAVKSVFIHTDPELPDHQAVKIFVTFAAPEGASKAIENLNGRFFGGRPVSASLYDKDKFDAKIYSLA